MTRFLADSASPPISVVINTLNRADLLDDAITGVMQLDYPAFELVVVNGPSTDHSEEVLKRWRGRIKHLRCDVPNLSVSRNVGIAGASGEIVAFLDDDAVPHPHWLRYLARNFADPSIGGVGGFTVDNTGVRWQVRKTVCDRFGNAHFPADSFDERLLNWPGTPLYCSLLGTNSSFRREALYEIGGFDHTFAYLLDETDVCLRMVDAGWNIVYEPAALIFHQFAASHIRSSTRKAKTLYPSVVSKTYFINHHGRAEGYGKVAHAMQDYRDELLRANAWLEEHGEISSHHRQALDSDVEAGTEAGLEASSRARLERKTQGDLATIEYSGGAFLDTAHARPLRVALVSQGLPPHNEAGIARWTMLLAQGLRDEGLAVHIITRARDLPNRRFIGGIWYHSVAAVQDDAQAIAATYRVPPSGVADWMAGVMREIAFLKTFGLDLVSFPIWDLEALPVLDDPDIAAVMSLHTSYKLARPFKPEWTSRVIYGRTFVEPMIAAETDALKRVPHILANSEAVIGEIEQEYGVSLGERAQIVPHGTPDILDRLGVGIEDKLSNQRSGHQLRVLFAGRFEPRKGHDLALKVAARFRGDARIRFEFVGATPSPALLEQMRHEFGLDPAGDNIVFHGEVDRAALEALYLAADAVLMPSRFESFGLVAIEAMSAGTPVLALAVGGLAEVVEDGVSGFLFPDEETFVSGSAERLAGLITDRAGLAALARSSHAAFKARFSDTVMARDVARFYRAIIAGEGGEND